MKKEVTTICYDEKLQIEAYQLMGIVRPFPNHFHEHYMIGYIENGKRQLLCKNKEYIVDKGDIVLFNPKDNHSCAQIDNETLDFRALNIPKDIMLDLVEDITNKRELIGFSENVIRDEVLLNYLKSLFKMIIKESMEFEKEENLISIVSFLIDKYGQSFEKCIPESCKEVEDICLFMENNYDKHIDLDEMAEISKLSKSTLLRAFTKSKGVTPYRYLQTLRINKAKKLLEEGISPIDAALKTGFSDQSHFTKSFTMFIGLSPGTYRSIFL